MKLWLLGIAAAVVLLIGLPAVALALADDPTSATSTDGPGQGPAHENPGHHYGWTKDHGSSAEHDDQADRGEKKDGRKGPPPWAHGHHAKSNDLGPPPWAHGNADDGTD